MAAGRRKRRRRNYRKRLLICLLVQILALTAFGCALGWNRGVSSFAADIAGKFSSPVIADLDLSGIWSTCAVLMDERSGKVISQVSGEERMYPASMTKVMTAIVAIEALPGLQKQITLSGDDIDQLYKHDATQAGFQLGEKVTALDLLYGVMLPSGAECCLALAQDISGSEAKFVEKMNEKAKKLGMDGTHFCDCTGLHDPEHYSPARDIAVLMRYAVHNPVFRKIAQAVRHTSQGTNLHPDGITYYSSMLKNMPDPSVTGGEILGGKTGYTDVAGHCLASFARIKDREYILVTAGAYSDNDPIPHIEDAYTIYNRLGRVVDGK